MARINSDCYIKQTDYFDVPLGTTNVGKHGCAASCLAMHLLSKMDTEIDDDVRREAVEAIAGSGFFDANGNIYHPSQSQSITVGENTYTIGYKKTSDIAAQVLKDKTGFVRFVCAGNEYTASHFVLVHDINTNETDPLKKLLVIDPSDATEKTLYQAMVDSYNYNRVNAEPSTAHLDANLKCVFDD